MTEIKASEGGRPVSELLERIARAMCAADLMDPDYPVYETADDGSTRLYGPCWWTYRERALAAMKELRFPTGAMVKAGFRVSGRPILVLQTMLDAEISIAEGGKDG